MQTAASVKPKALTPVSRPWQGAFWMVFSCACFSGINAIVRYWSGGVDSNIQTLPVSLIQFFQNIFGILFLLPWLLKSNLKTFKIRFFRLHLIRVITATLGVYLWYLSLQAIPMAEAVALSFTGPIFTIIAAFFWLKEKITAQRALAITLSLTGAFIISRPDLAFTEASHPIGLSVFLPLSSALALAASKLLTRKLTTLGESPTVLTTCLLVLMAPISLIPALREWITPSLTHLPWLTLMGVLTAAAHLSFTKAYQCAEVTFLTPFGFSKFFLNMLLGYVVFSELSVSPAFWLGTGVIMASLYVIAQKRVFFRI